MGCCHSDIVDCEVNDKSNDLNEVKEIQKVDDRIPLDARQVFKLKKSWKGVKRNLEETGVEMFIK